MKHHLRVLLTASALVVALGLGLVGASGCGSLPKFVGAETAQTIEVKTLQTARASLKTWKIVLKAVLIYKSYPFCDPENPELVLCRGHKSWAKVESIVKATSDFIEGRRALVEAGTDDVLFLIEVTKAVADAQNAIDEAKGKE